VVKGVTVVRRRKVGPGTDQPHRRPLPVEDIEWTEEAGRP